MVSYASRPSPKSFLTRAATFSQFFSSFLIPVSFSASDLSSSGPLVASAASFYAFSATAYAFLASSSHSLICFARINEGPLERLFCSLWIAHSILYSVGTKSSTWYGSVDSIILPPRGCMWQYRFTCSAVIRSRVTRTGDGARLNAALYYPLIRYQASLWRWGFCSQ